MPTCLAYVPAQAQQIRFKELPRPNYFKNFNNCRNFENLNVFIPILAPILVSIMVPIMTPIMVLIMAPIMAPIAPQTLGRDHLGGRELHPGLRLPQILRG